MQTAEPFQPHHGARFELLRKSADAETVRYQANIYFPLVTYQLEVQIDAAKGDCKIAPLASSAAGHAELEPWAMKHLLALAKQLYRAAKAEGGSWQRRLMRWRGAPAAGTAGAE